MIFLKAISYEQLNIRLQIGPIITKDEAPQYLVFDKENHLNPNTLEVDYTNISNTYPKASIIVDIDISHQEDEIPTTSALTFLDEAEIKLKKIIADLQEYIFSTKVGE